jgi:hypothetical protein
VRRFWRIKRYHVLCFAFNGNDVVRSMGWIYCDTRSVFLRS